MFASLNYPHPCYLLHQNKLHYIATLISLVKTNLFLHITSLSTVIPNGEDLLALKHFFDQRTVKEPKSERPETLLHLAELVLTLNCFSFGDNFFKQTNGVAMGTKMGPSYANMLC